MDCELVYEFVPRKKTEDIMFDQGIKKTRSLMVKDERMKELAAESLESKDLGLKINITSLTGKRSH